MRITAADLAQVVAGTVIGPDVDANGVSFDSRSVVSGQLFVAVMGERDGHMFVADAFSAGATIALVARSRGVDLSGIVGTLVEVDDTLSALNAYALHRRRTLSTVGNRVVGITGSAGKTSTKDFLVAALSSTHPRTHGAYRSFNNDIGVPVTVLDAPDECDALVLEMGMRGFGEIARLCAVAEPIIGLVTIVGDAHSDLVGGIDGVAEAKSELIRSLPDNGIAVLNADDERVRAMASLCRGTVVLYGISDDADVKLDVISVDEEGRCVVRVTHAGETAEFLVPVAGRHMALNAVGAIAAAVACGVALRDAVGAVADSAITNQRMQWKTGSSGVRVLDDSYNANSASMEAAIRTLASVPASHRVAVLAPMAEIADAEVAHGRVADLCRDLGIELIAVDTDLYGVAPVSVGDAVAMLAGVDTETAVLVKGSRAYRMEEVVEGLVG